MAGILAVPIHGTEDEVLELPKEALPDDPNEIMQILANELAPLKLWLELAVSYYQQERIDQFQLVMETSTGEDGPFYQDYYKPDKEGRISLLNCLAAYNTQIASRTKNKQKKDQHFLLANEHYQNSDKIDTQLPLTWVGKGLIFMAKLSVQRQRDSRMPGISRDQFAENLHQAGVMFENALDCDRSCIPALLGMAAVHYNRRQYSQALGLYKQVLHLNPACPPEVRLGLAQCYYATKQIIKAKKAFKRVLDLSPNNVDALVGLAVIEMNTDPPEDMAQADQDEVRERSVASALRLIERAYNASPENKNNSMVLNILANHYIIRDELDKAYTLAFHAYQNTEVTKMRAESCYHIARTHHMKQQFEQAHKYYQYAATYWPEFLLPQIGLGQCLIAQSKWSEATACLEKVLKANPYSYEVRKMIGCVCARSGEYGRALEHFKKITETEQEHQIDEEVWVELGTLHERESPSKALSFYHKARDALKSKAEKVPAELLNNIAALYHKLSDGKRAIRFYEKSLEAYGIPLPNETGELAGEKGEPFVEGMKGNGVTVLYNLARLHEAQHNYNVATHIYQAILRERPNYMDAYSRLGQIAEVNGSTKQASAWYIEALGVSPTHADSWTLLSKLYLNQGDFAQGQKKLEKILQKSPHDAYANIMLGNIYFTCAKFDHKEDSKEQDKMLGKYKQHLSRALDYYRRVLLKEGNNIYAANGAAAVLAQSGRLNEAKSVFTQLREAAAGQVPDVWINLAHIHYIQKEYGPAIKLYQAALDRFYDGHEVLLLNCIARAQFAAAVSGTKGKTKVMDRALLYKSKRTLQKAIHLSPRDWSLQFNMALVLKTWCESVMTGARDSHLAWMDAHKGENSQASIEAPPFSKQDLEQVQNDLMVMQRLSGILSQIESEREFPKDKRKEAETLDKFGEKAASILPQYMQALEDMRGHYEHAKAAIKKQEEAVRQEKEQQRMEEEEEARKKRLAAIERAKELEGKARELVASDDFLKGKPKQGKNKEDGEDDFIDDEAGRARLDRNKGPNKGSAEQQERRELMRCLEIFLAESEDEEEGDAVDEEAEHLQKAKEFMNSDDEENEKMDEFLKSDDDDDNGRKASGEDDEQEIPKKRDRDDDEQGEQSAFKIRRLQRDKDSDEEGSDEGNRNGDGEGDARGQEDAAPNGLSEEADDAGVSSSRKRNRVLDDDEDDD